MSAGVFELVYQLPHAFAHFRVHPQLSHYVSVAGLLPHVDVRCLESGAEFHFSTRKRHQLVVTMLRQVCGAHREEHLIINEQRNEKERPPNQ
jgi:hypothetical protein